MLSQPLGQDTPGAEHKWHFLEQSILDQYRMLHHWLSDHVQCINLQHDTRIQQRFCLQLTNEIVLLELVESVVFKASHISLAIKSLHDGFNLRTWM